ncbi:MAG: MFS transporter [Bacilli bacterium]
MTDQETRENLIARLDRMPYTRGLIFIMILLFFAWITESFDVGIIGATMLSVSKLWGLTASQQGVLGISSTVGIVIGLAVSGRLADRFGRRSLLMAGMAVFSIFSVFAALSSDVWILSLLRSISGLGEGAVFPLPYLILTEIVNMKRRGTVVGWVNGVLTAAYTIPSLIGAWVISTVAGAEAWRILFLLGGVPLLLLIPIALWLPESPRFLLRNGHIERVRSFVEKLEDEAGLKHDVDLARTADDEMVTQDETTPLRSLYRPPYVYRALISYLGFAGSILIFYTTLTYIPSIFHSYGFSPSQSLILVGGMMFLAGGATVVQGYLMDRIGRKRIYTVFTVVSAIGLVGLGFTHTLSSIALPALITAFFGVGINFLNKVYMAEQFPTALRGTGVSNGEAFGRFLSGIVGIYFIPIVLKTYGAPVLFVSVAVIIVLVMLPTAIWGRETSSVNLETAGAVSPVIDQPF